MWGSGAWGPTWIEGLGSPGTKGLLGCGCPEHRHSWGSGLYLQTPAGLPALAPARSLAAPAGPAAAGCCSFTLPRLSSSFTCELGCHLSEASPTSQPTSARHPLIFTTWGRLVCPAREDVSAGGSGGPRLGGASLGRAASVGAGSEPRPPPRVPQPLGLLVEGPEDHDLLLPGSVLYHAHHALQAGEAGRAPHTRAQGSALFPTWSGSGAGPGCLGEPHRRQQGVLSPWVAFPRGPGGTRPRGGPGCRGC